MPRIARKDVKSPFLHIMVQGINKEYIFCKEQYIKYYLKIIESNIKYYNCTIIAYCIMNNHAHFLIYTKDIVKLGKFMQKVNLQYAQMYNKEEKRCGVLFRNRYKSEQISSKRYLINCIRYIHENPVKANIVSKCGDYQYSSYLDYVKWEGITQSPIMKKIFENRKDYEIILKSSYIQRFIDVDKSNDVEEYIKSGIREFTNLKRIKILDIFCNRNMLKELIGFLNKNCNIRYIEIKEFFDMTRGIIDGLKM